MLFQIQRMLKNFRTVAINLNVPANKILLDGKDSAARNVFIKKNLLGIGITNHNAEIAFGHVETQPEIKIQSQAFNARLAINHRVKNLVGQLEQFLYILKKKSLIKIFRSLAFGFELIHNLAINFPIVLNVFRAEKMNPHVNSSLTPKAD